jgi:predicted metal-binding protein
LKGAKEVIIRSIKSGSPNLEKLFTEMGGYVELALQTGATHARIITAADIVLDPRVQYKCMIPKCVSYGTCAHCPPHVPGIEETEKVLKCFHFAVLAAMSMPASNVMRATDGSFRPEHDINPPMRSKMHEIVCKVEAQAFYDGHYFATAFSSGACKKLWCPEEPCQVLAGKGCRNPLKARPSMEAMGMDVYRMITEAGWDIYPVGSKVRAEDIPHGVFAGVVLIH